MKKQLLIIGGGFAGFWSALSAVRESRTLGKQNDLEITMINTDRYFTIRPRLYEPTAESLRLELQTYLSPIGVRLLIGRVETIDPVGNYVSVFTGHGLRDICYDYLILASGSSLKGANYPGMEHTYNVDTFNGSKRLDDHIVSLAKTGFAEDGDSTFVVAGAGLVGLEVATGISDRASKIQARLGEKPVAFEVILVERNQQLAASYPSEGREYIHSVLNSKNIRLITGAEVTTIEPFQLYLSTGERIPSRTVIWATGMSASSLTAAFHGERDSLNRLHVDAFLKLPHYDNVIVAGDVARVSLGNGLASIMACQYAQFEGRWAGHNAVNDLFGFPLKPYHQDDYLTALDLGTDHALYTTGWGRDVRATGQDARDIKSYLNTWQIYPPEDPEAALSASYPEISQF